MHFLILILVLTSFAMPNFSRAASCERSISADIALLKLMSAKKPTVVGDSSTLEPTTQELINQVLDMNEVVLAPSFSWILQNMNEAYLSSMNSEKKTSLLTLFNIIQLKSGSTAAILELRKCSNERTFDVLSILGESTDDALRKSSAHVLSIMVSNKSLCTVLKQINNEKSSKETLLNNIGIAKIVANYAYKENVTEINSTVESIKNRFSTFSSEWLAIQELKNVTDKSPNKELAAPVEFRGHCQSTNNAK